MVVRFAAHQQQYKGWAKATTFICIPNWQRDSDLANERQVWYSTRPLFAVSQPARADSDPSFLFACQVATAVSVATKGI